MDGIKMSMREIEEVNFNSYEFIFENFLIKNKPVKIRGFYNDTSFLNLSLDSLSEKFGDTIIPVEQLIEGGMNFNNDNFFAEKIEIPFRDYLTKHMFDGYHYLAQIPIDKYFPELLNEFPIHDSVPKNLITDINFWIAGKEAKSPLHFDNGNNFFTQIKGEKTFILYPPSDTEFLYPLKVGEKRGYFSTVDAFNPNYEQFPLLKETSPIKLKLKKGEVLFMPTGWWHHVKSEGVSISINTWVKNYDFQFNLPNHVTHAFNPHDVLLDKFLEKTEPYQYESFEELILDFYKNEKFKEAFLTGMALLENTMRKKLIQNNIKTKFGKEIEISNNFISSLKISNLVYSNNLLGSVDDKERLKTFYPKAVQLISDLRSAKKIDVSLLKKMYLDCRLFTNLLN